MTIRPQRLARMRQVLDQRLVHVCCAIEAVHHRHNVSAILRTCDSLGLHRVHLVEGHFSPARGAARGADRWLEIHRQRDPEAAIATLRAAGYRLYVADLDERGVAPEEVPLDQPVCVWMGAELSGVGEAARQAADGVITVPMRGFSQSLNVSVAAAMTLRAVAERARVEIGEPALLPVAKREALYAQWVAREEARMQGAVARSRQKPPPDA